MACKEAISLAEDLGVSHRRVAWECLKVVTALRGNNLGQFFLVLQEIKSQAPRFTGVEFRHEERAANKEAHCLARASTSRHTGRYVWFLQSPDLIVSPWI